MRPLSKAIGTLFLFIYLAFLPAVLKSQDNRNSLFIEGGGTGFIYSLNYDHRFNPELKGLGLRMGVGGLPLSNSDYFIAIPVHVNYLIGKNRSFLELGAGITYLSIEGVDDDLEGKSVTATFCIMYRQQSPDGGFT